ncbi:MAG: hypothetical protein C4536_05235 [Actinobacteria bacterium]|nr:MAG: hypothetical protein C4536_05235 [Actinomycetota bacterium]
MCYVVGDAQLVPGIDGKAGMCGYGHFLAVHRAVSQHVGYFRRRLFVPGILDAQVRHEAGSAGPLREIETSLRRGDTHYVMATRPHPVVVEVHGALGHDTLSVHAFDFDGKVV